MNNSGKKRVTLSDIAHATGYSINAVSRALRNMDDIGADTTSYIQSTAKRMGYVANRAAASLRNGNTNVIAVIISDLVNPFFGIVCDLLQREIAQAGCSMMILCSRNDTATEFRMVEQAIAIAVYGVLIFPTHGAGPAVARLHDANIPYVLMTRYFQPDQDDCVIFEDKRGAYLATNHLLAQGHQRVAFITPNQTLYSADQRRFGFLQACDEAGIPPKDRLIHITDYNTVQPDSSAGWQLRLADRLRSLRDSGFTGLFVFCDVEVWHILEAIKTSKDLREEDFGLVGFDNINRYLSSPLSFCSIDCQLQEVCAQGVALLRNRIGGDDRPPQTIVTHAELVCRSSCRKI